MMMRYAICRKLAEHIIILKKLILKYVKLKMEFIGFQALQEIMELPDARTRQKILEIHTKDPLGRNVDLITIAEVTEGFSGADFSAIANTAVSCTARIPCEVLYT